MKFVSVGFSAGSFGLRGGIKIKPVTDNPQIFYEMEYLMLAERNKEVSKTFKVLSAEHHGEYFIIKCEGVDTKEKADALKNMSVMVPEDILPAEESDEVYWYKIEGAQVLDPEGSSIGILTDYLETGSGDVFKVKLAAGGNALISNNEKHVLSIDPAGHKVVIEPEGLVREDV